MRRQGSHDIPDPRWTPAQVRLWEAHGPRLSNPRGALTLMGRWLDHAAPPPGGGAFLHLLYLAGTSESLFLALLRHADQLSHLSRQVGSATGMEQEGMDEALARFMLQHRWPSPASALSAFRALQTARILLQDVLGILPFEDLTKELSNLADVLIQRSLAMTYQPLRESLGIPLMAGQDGRPSPCRMAVFALGKLGGLELNYASDVDLIALYEGEGTTDQGRPNGAFFNAWVQAGVGLLTSSTPDGPCLRVDLNLRPRGRDGELTLPFDAALAYYREWSDLWERQAWIKARACGGDIESGGRFLKRMEEIVYQPYSWTGIATQVRRGREQTIARLADQAPRDVKDGPGGIRDAEFAIQALQLAHGPRDRWIRERHSLLALSKLAQKGHLSTARQSALAQHYTLLRRVEHWVQYQDMRQSHRLPGSQEAWWALSRNLLLPGPEEAEAAITATRGELRAIFTRILEELEERDSESEALASMFSPEGMLEILQRGRFRDPARALPLLAGIYETLAPHLDRPQRKENLVRIHFSLRREFERARDPYQGLAVLSRLVQSLAGEPGVLPVLLDHPRLPRLLFRLAVQSEPLTESLMRMPSLVPLLAYGAMRDLTERLERPPGAEGGPDALRCWQKGVLVLIQAREIILAEGVAWSQRNHSELANRICSSVFGSACAAVEGREGLEPGLLSGSLGLIALGRQGFAEMNPRSDLDLVFIKRGKWVFPEDPERSARAEASVLREMAGALAAVTRHGSLYEADFRLRPYGSSGMPVQSLDALRDYFSAPAHLWERISYLKASPVAGDPRLCAEALQMIWNLVVSRGAASGEPAQLMDLRRRLEGAAPGFEGALKFRIGGLLQLDLAVFILQVRAGLLPGAGGMAGLLGRLEGLGVLDSDRCRDLYKARAFMEGFLHRSRLHFSRPPAPGWPENIMEQLDTLWIPRISGFAEGAPEGALERQWEECRAVVAEVWDRVVEGRG